ncbi:MAG TPA: trehalose-6-phosphate synthase [Acidimicrobiia bacterium]|nr:trehalose-6-phosphate synthase [Acidimicrobiia bacterium]
MTDSSSRLVVAANRLPVRWDSDDRRWVTSPGGLVSALVPILQERGGVWVGWNGSVGGESERFTADEIDNLSVPLDEEQVNDHYYGFCNGTIWPLYHDAIRPPEFHRHWWRKHAEVNQQFADAIISVCRPGDTIWVHDYQLQLVPEMVRQHLPGNRIGFFLHIPFPPPEIFERLPWRRQILEGLLGADYIGFQTRRAALNFAASAREFAGARGPAASMRYANREVRAEPVPIAIDTAHYAGAASDLSVQRLGAELRRDLGDPPTIILGVDRLDYTKGIDLRLRVLETFFDEHPELIGKVSLVQISVPSREDVDEYQEIRRQVEEMVGRVNGRFAQAGWTPIHYVYRSIPFEELIGAYLTADVMLVTPLRDGMNLVAKEYIATRVDDSGVLILSEFAGAAEQLEEALIVNPYDLDALSATIHQAVTMGIEEQRRRMRRLRRKVTRWDVHSWARHNLEEIA